MKYRKFTKNSISVSEIGLGGWQLGENSGWRKVTDKDAFSIIHKSLDLGVNFFDTAPNYGFGSSEIRLGKALQIIDRDKVVINTKFGHTVDGKINFSSSFIRQSIEGSLKRLQCDFVDSLIIHNPPEKYLDGNQNDHYEIFEKLREEGKIKSYGASLDTYQEMKLLMETTNAEVIEAFFNILHQDSSRAFQLANANEVAIIAKIPLDSGWLTGKYDESSTFADVRNRWTKSDLKTRAYLIKKLKSIIGQNNELTKTAISFCLAYEQVSTVIPGNTSIEQLENNIANSQNILPQKVKVELEHFYQNEVAGLKIPW